jgi:hypothetical protein
MKELVKYLKESKSGILIASKGIGDSNFYYKGNKDELIVNLAALFVAIEKEKILDNIDILQAIYLSKEIEEK